MIEINKVTLGLGFLLWNSEKQQIQFKFEFIHQSFEDLVS